MLKFVCAWFIERNEMNYIYQGFQTADGMFLPGELCFSLANQKKVGVSLNPQAGAAGGDGSVQ